MDKQLHLLLTQRTMTLRTHPGPFNSNIHNKLRMRWIACSLGVISFPSGKVEGWIMRGCGAPRICWRNRLASKSSLGLGVPQTCSDLATILLLLWSMETILMNSRAGSIWVMKCKKSSLFWSSIFLKGIHYTTFRQEMGSSTEYYPVPAFEVRNHVTILSSSDIHVNEPLRIWGLTALILHEVLLLLCQQRVLPIDLTSKYDVCVLHVLSEG